MGEMYNVQVITTINLEELKIPGASGNVLATTYEFDSIEHAKTEAASWGKKGLHLNYMDEFNRDLNFFVAPVQMVAIRYWIPFTYEIGANGFKEL
ncbi:MAG: hypothetical protein KAS39_04345 [Actinomycetia bacterium]|nr:hypothetical protein [Actinomycetes bacterium]